MDGLKEKNERHLARNCELGYEERAGLLKVTEDEGYILNPYLRSLEERVIDSVKTDPLRAINEDDVRIRMTLKSAVYLFGLAELRVQRPMSHGAMILGLSASTDFLGRHIEDYKTALTPNRNIFRDDQILIFTKRFLEHYERLHFQGYGLPEFDGFTVYKIEKAFAANQVFGLEMPTYREVLKRYNLEDKGDPTTSFRSDTALGVKGYNAYAFSGLFKGFSIVTSHEHKTARLIYASKLMAKTAKGDRTYTFFGDRT